MDSKLDQNVKTMDKAQGQSMDSATPYKKLALVITINGVIMFLLTYAMIDRFDHFYANINRVYMSVMMVAPMVVLMLLVMGSMYKNKKLNYALIAAFAAIGLLAADGAALPLEEGTRAQRLARLAADETVVALAAGRD